MKFIIGYKSHMTQNHRSDGRVVPVTVVKAEPCIVTQIRTIDRDGYVALQVGTGARKRTSKPIAGHLKALGTFSRLREFRPAMTDKIPDLKVGDKLDIGQFAAGDKVNVTGYSKGRGFQGVVKRHGFHGSPKTHGHKDQLRMPGSIGATAPQRVFKGMRMAGHMGNARTSVKHLEVVDVNVEKSELALKGAVPGARRSLVLIQAV
ncbi:50S ribosomal protein L3 [Candidatus Uhrbacteria bacterium RIFCSPLOWO2_12_FULL_46_10]|uniref:Large ribosomal subunit protein uL3 n=1 Tax=Candidatus Uhrbacteria bacterium RIFCSPLOWO2_01_FULL_47_25 TaxID=1802402 RepID=A0A1F7UX26_9BACT|nr:MAG: 50S ribosomal protein L3 [Candidatus Uhrbacteria bacterium RIFCSPHIGHO2_01_FULL_46_23]OGL70269.1 MAG: 50S ribosomal protein L3 [Candidatus Uhrbacteria bacterium RIFCSPHIGHO2_02_FULL_47_29]OGL74690.1 MAG: 50S ribosomal protein L3 [Candidatus Uhrbacteria bacterium RIFCSPHIGHO2_12_FULL_46_13]OGL82806.1 MAG: 50S ribosomal protein L3 [Candidatus Uhrbacteria bacterium RIFCSPLOWO2_01_FULL_47_25]OGL83900.1 MAG: 50S ribosomal protein L3 [Candidatus Uhrbacteria bacterium RIFCSPLOWO2_02_FULL_46_19